MWKICPMRLLPILAAAWLAVPAAVLAADDAAEPAAAAVTAPTVTVAPAGMAQVEARVPLSGTLVARQSVQVYPQVSGFAIVALNAEPGDRVTKGQELARLSDTTLRTQLAQAEAELLRAAAGVSQAQSQISSSDAAQKQARAAADRARALRRSGSGTQAALDQAVAAQAAADAAAASARDGLAVAEATLAQARAARDLAQANLDWTRILSPVDGRVTQRSAQLGGIASAAGEPMFTLIADGSIEFEGEVIEGALQELRPGQEVRLNVAGVGPIQGTVRQLPAAVDPTTRLGLIRVQLPDDDRLLTGLFASGDVITLRREALTVPASAVLSDDDGERVQVVRDGVVETRPIQGGILWQGRREVRGGLAEAETVITRAGAFFATGDEVNVARPAAEGEAAPAGAVAGSAGAEPAAEAAAAEPAVAAPAGTAQAAGATPAEPAAQSSEPAAAPAAGPATEASATPPAATPTAAPTEPQAPAAPAAPQATAAESGQRP